MHKQVTHPQTSQGFTIVELLVVIVVIGILAAITIVSFNGVSNKAKVAALQTDIRGTAEQLAIVKESAGGTYPSTLATVNGGNAPTPSGGASYSYSTNGSAYCLAITSPSATPASYYISSSTGRVQAGTCQTLVTVIAGAAGVSGAVNGPGTSARFNGIYGLDVDSVGNVYVADANNNLIRKITPDGTVSTFAGSGASGSANSTNPLAATFNTPYGITVDASDNVFIGDTGNHTIRKINQAGVVTTFAGVSGTPKADNTGFRTPYDIDIDNSGNIYVAEANGSSQVKKVTQAGVISSLAGIAFSYGDVNGAQGTSQIGSPFGITVNKSTGVVYVINQDVNKIKQISTSSVLSDYVGGSSGYADGTGSAAQFTTPQALDSDAAGNLYVGDQGTGARIRKVSAGGIVTTLAGGGTVAASTNTPSDQVRFSGVKAVATAPDGTIYAADSFAVYKIVPSY